MGQVLGLITAAAQLGLQSVLVRPARSIGPFTAQVTFEETHTDELEITDHPIESGAVISDHAYMRPSEVVIRCGWSDSPSVSGFLGGLVGAVTSTVAGVSSVLSGNSVSQSRDVYEKLQALQRGRVPMSVTTGKRTYSNMLVKSLRVVTDRESENSLMAVVTLREVLIVGTATVSVAQSQAPASAQLDAATTYPVAERGVKAVELGTLYNPAAGAAAIDPTGAAQ